MSDRNMMDTQYQPREQPSATATTEQFNGFWMDLFRDNCSHGIRMAVFLIVFFWAIFIFILSLVETGLNFPDSLSIATFVFQLITFILFIIFSGGLFWYYANELKSSPLISFQT